MNGIGPNPALRPLGLVKRIAVATAGLIKYLLTGRSALAARMALLDLHCRTNGRSTKWIAPLIHTIRPPRPPAAASGVLGHFSIEEQDRIARSIARDGFYIFDQKMPAEICDQIERFAAQTPTLVHDAGEEPKPRVVYDPAAPVSKIYRIPEQDSITNHAIQRLVADPVFLGIAERYLATLPIFSDIGLWWSPAGDKWPHQDAAQKFHFDFDAPPAWLKLFVYLTDVGPDNGPHTFVRGSHIAGNPVRGPLLEEGYSRMTDEKIASAFGADNVVSIEGKRGTVFFADTSGFHKGRAPVAGHRLLTVFLYGPPHFNDWIDDTKPGKHALPPDIEPMFAAALAKTPRVYQRYL